MLGTMQRDYEGALKLQDEYQREEDRAQEALELAVSRTRKARWDYASGTAVRAMDELADADMTPKASKCAEVFLATFFAVLLRERERHDERQIDCRAVQKAVSDAWSVGLRKSNTGVEDELRAEKARRREAARKRKGEAE